MSKNIATTPASDYIRHSNEGENLVIGTGSRVHAGTGRIRHGMIAETVCGAWKAQARGHMLAWYRTDAEVTCQNCINTAAKKATPAAPAPEKATPAPAEVRKAQRELNAAAEMIGRLTVVADVDSLGNVLPGTREERAADYAAQVPGETAEYLDALGVLAAAGADVEAAAKKAAARARKGQREELKNEGAETFAEIVLPTL